jgi:hypothetical protein
MLHACLPEAGRQDRPMNPHGSVSGSFFFVPDQIKYGKKRQTVKPLMKIIFFNMMLAAQHPPPDG